MAVFLFWNLCGRRLEPVLRRLTARLPNAGESKLLNDLLAGQTSLFQQEPDRAAKLISVGEHKTDPKPDTIQLAALTEVAQAIMNLDATIWKR